MRLKSCNAQDIPHNKELPCPGMSVLGKLRNGGPTWSHGLSRFSISSICSKSQISPSIPGSFPDYLLEISSGCLTAHQTQRVYHPTLARYSTLLIAQAKNIGGILDFIFSHPTSNPSANYFSNFLKTGPALTTSHQFTATTLVSSTISHLRTGLPVAELTPLQSILNPTPRVIL